MATATQGEKDNPLTFAEFIRNVRPKYLWFRHCKILVDALQKVADGEITRLMVFIPPRHGKSETVSRLFSAYYLYRHSDRFVGVNSYAQELANTLSRASRENYKASGGLTKGDADAIKHWETVEGGGLWAAGVGGPITGKGFHLGIIDDPLKNAEDASSEVIRANQQEWYQSTFYTREEPGGAIVVVQTRWNEMDLSGFLLSQEGEDEPERWHILNLPAIAEEQPAFPTTCTVIPDWRQAGEALCPERYDLARLRRIEARIGPYYWGALYQQQPRPREGDFFKPDRMPRLMAPPVCSRKVRAWDLGATESGNPSAGVHMGKIGERYAVLDVARFRESVEKRDQRILDIAHQDGRQTKILLPEDPGAGGKASAEILVKRLLRAGFTVEAKPVSGKKEIRAEQFASSVNGGETDLVEGPWNYAFTEELRGFPNGANDDQVDAGGDAFRELALINTGKPATAKKTVSNRDTYTPGLRF
jgi:predicted phage terminase large subunit-like protein